MKANSTFRHAKTDKLTHEAGKVGLKVNVEKCRLHE